MAGRNYYEKNILIKKIGKIIEFRNIRNMEILKFDLSDKKFYRNEKEYKSYKKFFVYQVLQNLYTEGDTQSEEYLEFLFKFNNNVLSKNTWSSSRFKNIGSIIERASLDEAYHLNHFEKYIKLGISFDRNIREDVNSYNKQVLKFIKENNVIISLELENLYFKEENGKEIIEHLIHQYYSKYQENQNTKKFIERLLSNNEKLNIYKEIIVNYKLDKNNLLNYIKDLYDNEFYFISVIERRNVDILILLRDYHSMMTLISPKGYRKYPNDLIYSHNICIKLYNQYKEVYDDLLFSKIYENYKNLEFELKETKENKEYCKYKIILPEKTLDIKNEGCHLNHCVGSYINRILDKRSIIIFLREKENIDKSLVTIEIINNKITQVRGFSNRIPSENEIKFIKEFVKNKNLEWSN